ncbi:MAG: RNase adapter RapZ [Rhodospirillaceae bacterium]
MTEQATRTVPSAGPQSGPARHRVVLVTGMSGAGKTAALKAFEDLGYEAVDNLPLSLLPNIAQPSVGGGRPLAVGVDIRTRDFGVDSFLAEIDTLMADPQLDVRVLFFDCDDEVLQRRYTETRRRHPLAVDRPVRDGIEHERRLVSPLRDRADIVMDTSLMLAQDLRQRLREQFGLEETPGIAVFITSFAYRRGLPREADLVFDVRFLANPHYEGALRPLTGLDPAVGGYIARDPGYGAFFQSLTGLLQPLLPRFSQEGKSYLTIAVGCTGGRHRSVFVAEEVAAWLRASGERVTVSHRDLPPADGQN